jgi:hypothetical protein
MQKMIYLNGFSFIMDTVELPKDQLASLDLKIEPIRNFGQTYSTSQQKKLTSS